MKDFLFKFAKDKMSGYYDDKLWQIKNMTTTTKPHTTITVKKYYIYESCQIKSENAIIWF